MSIGIYPVSIGPNVSAYRVVSRETDTDYVVYRLTPGDTPRMAMGDASWSIDEPARFGEWVGPRGTFREWVRRFATDDPVRPISERVADLRDQAFAGL